MVHQVWKDQRIILCFCKQSLSIGFCYTKVWEFYDFSLHPEAVIDYYSPFLGLYQYTAEPLQKPFPDVTRQK
jgi:hypothetical protein